MGSSSVYSYISFSFHRCGHYFSINLFSWLHGLSCKLSYLCFLDLSAAFDIIDHNILITRLLSWFAVFPFSGKSGNVGEFCFDWNVRELSGNLAVYWGIFCSQMPSASFVTDNKRND